MFEQAFLTESHGRSGSRFLVSLTIQAALIGIAILLPLYYTDRIPTLTLEPLPLSAPVMPRPLEPMQRQAHSTTVQQRPSSAPVFRAPTSIRPLSEGPSVVQLAAPNGGEFAVDGPSIRLGIPGALLETKADRVAPPPPTPVAPKQISTGPVRVSAGVQAAKLIKQVMPVYPPLARAARVYGTVRLVGVIGKDGHIQRLTLVSGHPLLSGAALDAVRQWLYAPTLLSGEPVEVVAPIGVNFTLNQ